jgi:hypothetical protein
MKNKVLLASLFCQPAACCFSQIVNGCFENNFESWIPNGGAGADRAFAPGEKFSDRAGLESHCLFPLKQGN